MKEYSKKYSKKLNPRQAVREARKRAQPVFEPGETQLLFATEAGHEVWALVPKPQILGYTYSF